MRCLETPITEPTHEVILRNRKRPQTTANDRKRPQTNSKRTQTNANERKRTPYVL